MTSLLFSAAPVMALSPLCEILPSVAGYGRQVARSHGTEREAAGKRVFSLFLSPRERRRLDLSAAALRAGRGTIVRSTMGEGARASSLAPTSVIFLHRAGPLHHSAEPVIGPATSGRTRWRAVPLPRFAALRGDG